MSNPKQVLGIDFGTANSYFCTYFVEPDGHKIRTIDFGNNQLGGIASTLLYRQDKPAVVGIAAEQEWGEASPAERRGYRLRTHFKPDISRSEDARQDSKTFLQTIREQLQSRHVPFMPEQYRVIIGIPGEADRQFKTALLDIARDAGYGEVRLVYEPLGALLYHLWNHDISPEETQRGILVVDFGGGTCDFAYMQRLEVSESWGDMFLGGRLFDDLFFQWYLEQNPGALETITASGDEYIVHWMECRKIKEFFSERMAISRQEILRARVGQRQYGAMQQLSWEAFVERATHYRPHATFLAYLKDRGIDRGKLFAPEPINLFEWFRQSLLDGLEKHRIRSSDIERVILTGGSSLWPFVKDIICQELHIEPNRLLTSDNPKAAISEGLVVLPSLQFKYESVSNRLREELPSFFENTIEPEINSKLDDIVEQIVNDVTVRLYDEQISPAIQNFRRKGGTIASLKTDIQNTVQSHLPGLEQNIRERLLELQEGLPAILHEKVMVWFRQNGISYFGRRVSPQEMPESYSGTSDVATPKGISNLHEEITDITGGFIILISASIVGTITGGSQTALLISGPAGWLIGAIMTVVAGWVALQYGRDKISEVVENIDLPAAVVKMILWDSKVENILQEGRGKMTDMLRAEIGGVIEKPFEQMKQRIRSNIDREINNLSLINHL